MDQDAVDLALLVFRCAIGAVMFAHGYQHLFRGGKVEVVWPVSARGKAY